MLSPIILTALDLWFIINVIAYLQGARMRANYLFVGVATMIIYQLSLYFNW